MSPSLSHLHDANEKRPENCVRITLNKKYQNYQQLISTDVFRLDMINSTVIQPSDKNIAEFDKVVASNHFTVSLYLKFQSFLHV